MQDNQLHSNLTVDEAMSVAAKLKIGSEDKKKREEIVSYISILFKNKIVFFCINIFKYNYRMKRSFLHITYLFSFLTQSACKIKQI